MLLRLGILLCLSAPTVVFAQGQETSFDVQTFRPSPHGRGFLSVESGGIAQKLELRGSVWMIYAFKPFEVVDTTGARVAGIVDHRLDLEFNAAVAFLGRISIAVAVPATLFQLGSLSGFLGGGDLNKLAFGDLRLSPKIGILDQERFHIEIAVLATLSVPTGDERAFAGDRNVTFAPELAVSRWFGPFRMGLNFGYLWRQSSQILDITIGQELYARLGASLDIGRIDSGVPLDIIGEIYGRTSATEPFATFGTSPLEWVAGLRYTPIPEISFMLGGGRGILNGFGSPAARAFFQFAFVPIAEKRLETKKPGDRDKDGFMDDVDACPDSAEDFDNFADTDGCPEKDNDADGIFDTVDNCPNEAEDIDDFQDQDGCPDKDNDEDKILDARDPCPMEPEDFDNFEDDDGCPDMDNDGDGILDPEDSCPNEPEVINGVDDFDGCPDKGKSLVVLATEQIGILQKVQFKTNSAKILPKSFGLLKQVAAVMKNHASIKSVRIEGHTDERASEAYNVTLSQKRAESVRDFLIKEGLAPERLVAKGYGETKPVSSNKTARGREANRRVVFAITEQSASSQPTSLEAAPSD